MNSIVWLERLCIFALVVFNCNISLGDNNLLSNYSFEEKGTGVPATSWNTYNCGYTRSGDVAKEGSWSCKIIGTGGIDEDGFGGAYSVITGGLPVCEKFTVSSNIYIASYTQGTIYSTYVTVNYTDSSQETFFSTLSDVDINANINTWKNYSSTFTTNPTKNIYSIIYWALVWKEDGNKFIGTVYFDDLKLEVFKPYLYWQGDRIFTATNPDQAAGEVLNRGFTHAVVSQFDSSAGDRALFLSSKGFEVVKNISPTIWKPDLAFSPRSYSPYNDLQNYLIAKQELTNLLINFPGITGIVDDVEDPPFPRIKYTADGITEIHTFSDLEERIGNQAAQCTGWPVFKNWPATGDHDVSNLNMENIEYNFPTLSIDNSGTPSAAAIVGYYGSGFSYESYEMAAQTFKPANNRITRIDVMVKRSSTAFPLGNIYYYLTEVDAYGKPDLSKKISYPTCTIQSSEVDYSASLWDGIEPLSLYFDPEEIGLLDTNKQYALVLEFSKKNNNDWNEVFYYASGFNTDVYNDGQAWRRSYGAWISFNTLADFWIKIYKPTPPAGFALNQFHEDWIDFQCVVIARYVDDYRSIVNSVSPIREIWIYSGYTGINYSTSLHNYDGVTRRAYSANWEMLSDAGIDYAICGYGTHSITATLNALNASYSTNPPKLIGGGYTPYGEVSFVDRCNNCDGGMLYYGGTYLDDPGWSVP